MKGMMNHRIRVRHWSWPSAARTATSVIAVAGLALLAGGCSGGPPASSPNGAGAASASPAGGVTSQLVAYSECMRAHGVPEFPDPTGQGLPKGSAQQFGVSNSVLSAAQSACQHLLPTAESAQQQVQQCLLGGDCPQALVQRILTAEREFAGCMRSHGVSGWPDPSLNSLGRPVFILSAVGITHSQTHSPMMAAKIAECERLDPSPVPMQ